MAYTHRIFITWSAGIHMEHCLQYLECLIVVALTEQEFRALWYLVQGQAAQQTGYATNNHEEPPRLVGDTQVGNHKSPFLINNQPSNAGHQH